MLSYLIRLAAVTLRAVMTHVCCSAKIQHAKSTDKENPMIAPGLRPHINTIDEPPIFFLGLPTILRATAETTNGAFGLMEQVMPPCFASPYHLHHLEDEAFYVLEGEM